MARSSFFLGILSSAFVLRAALPLRARWARAATGSMPQYPRAATAHYRVRYRVLLRSLPRATAFAISCSRVRYRMLLSRYRVLLFSAPCYAFNRALPRATALSAAVLHVLLKAKKNRGYFALLILPGAANFGRVLPLHKIA